MTSMSTGIDAMFGAAKGAADAASTVAKGAAGVAKGAADAAVDTAAGVTKLPVPGVASGHEQCTPGRPMALPTAGSPPRHCVAPAALPPAPASIS